MSAIMTRVVLPVVILILGASCVTRTGSQKSSGPARTATPEAAPVSTGEVSNKTEAKVPPPEFKETDFRNFSYPTSLRGRIRLREGTYEHADPPGGGGDTFDFYDVHYLDITGDAKQDAIVDLIQVSCGVSCDGGSHLFYFYSGRERNPKLFWRFETGPLAYGCGLKSFVASHGEIALETFKSCVFRNAVIEEANDRNEISGGKFSADSYTRFKFEYVGNAFRLKNREVFPFPDGDTKNYPSKIEVSE